MFFVGLIILRLLLAMRRYSPPYYSPPRRGYGGRGRSPPPPPRRGYGGGRKGSSHGSLLVRNIPLDCRYSFKIPPIFKIIFIRLRFFFFLLILLFSLIGMCRPEELRSPFERFGPVRDVYIPRDYYSGSVFCLHLFFFLASL